VALIASDAHLISVVNLSTSLERRTLTQIRAAADGPDVSTGAPSAST